MIRLLWILVVLVPLFQRAKAEGAEKPTEESIQSIVRVFCKRLGIKQPVTVSIVAENPRLSSVEFTPDKTGFQMSFCKGFIDTLDAQDLEAAVAHEMGHVWIFTHFPYLQTEELANTYAQKLVPRDHLVHLYQKVQEWNGRAVDLHEVLGSSQYAKAGTN